MTGNEYQTEVMRTAVSADLPIALKGAAILEGVMGLCGESGECLELVKKRLFQGHKLDKRHLALELGDVAWYLAYAAHALGYDLETIMRMNVDKLWNRYPEGFDPKRSQKRQEGDI